MEYSWQWRITKNDNSYDFTFAVNKTYWNEALEKVIFCNFVKFIQSMKPEAIDIGTKDL